MKKYKVNYARTTYATVFVEAEDEEQALEEAYGELPGFTAQESGWGSFGKWSADADDWLTLDDFYWPNYSEKEHGPVIEEVDK